MRNLGHSVEWGEAVTVSELIRKMQAAGAPMEAILIAVEAVEAAKNELEGEKEKNRAAVRERVRKHRENKAKPECNVTETLPSRYGNHTRAHTRVEDNLQTKIHTGDKDTQTRKSASVGKSDLEEFRSVLAEFTDADRIEAFVKHRRTKRAAFTAHAAKLFIRDARSAGLTVPEAIDTAISRNWITVKADWLTPKGGQRANSDPPRQPHQDSFQAAIQRRLSKAHEPDHNTERHDDTGNRGAGFAGAGPVIDLLAVSGRGGR